MRYWWGYTVEGANDPNYYPNGKKFYDLNKPTARENFVYDNTNISTELPKDADLSVYQAEPNVYRIEETESSYIVSFKENYLKMNDQRVYDSINVKKLAYFYEDQFFEGIKKDFEFHLANS
jgi:hypothetical protein